MYALRVAFVLPKDLFSLVLCMVDLTRTGAQKFQNILDEHTDKRDLATSSANEFSARAATNAKSFRKGQ